jgi:hypothetical protein
MSLESVDQPIQIGQSVRVRESNRASPSFGYRVPDPAVGDVSGRVLIATEGTRSECSAAPDRPGWGRRLPIGDGSSVVDCLDAKLLEAFDVVLHRLQDVGGMPLPVRKLARDP